MSNSNHRTNIVLSAVDRTRAAIDSAKRNLASLKASGDAMSTGLVSRFGSIGAALAGVFAGVSLKGVIDGADELSKLSQKTGVTVESLGALKYAGELSDVSVQDLGTGMKKLSVQMADAAGGGKQSAAIFQKMGVQIKTSAGTLRNVDDVLGDIAEAFAGFEDGPEKAALAVALFGKSGEKLIPFLNAGRQGLAEMKAEAEALGVVFGDKLAREAEAFNDNLSRLKVGLEGSAVALLGDLLPALNRFLAELIEGKKAFGGFGAALVELGVNRDPFISYGEHAKTARLEVEQLNAELARLKINPGLIERANAFFGVGGQQQAQLEDRLGKSQASKRFFEAMQRREALEAGEGVVETNPAVRAAQKKAAKKRAPIVGGAGDDGEALLRKQLDGRLQGLSDGLANERDLLAHQGKTLEAQYADGELSIEQFYDRRQQLALDDLAAQQRVFDESIRQWQDYQRKTSKAENKAEAGNQIAKLGREQGKALREQGQAAELDVRARERATEAYGRSLTELDAQLASMSGDELGAELLRGAQQMREASKLLGQGGGDPARLAQLGQGLELQAFVNEAHREADRLGTSGQASEQRFELHARRDGLGLIEGERELAGLRQQSLAQLGSLIERVQDYAAATKNPEVLAFLDSLKLRYEALAELADPQKLRLDAAADDIGHTLADGFAHAALEGEKLSDVLHQLDKQLAGIVLNEVFTKPVGLELANIVKGAGGKGAGVNLLSFLMPGGSSKPASIAAGGIDRSVAGTIDNPSAERDALRALEASAYGSATATDVATQATKGSADALVAMAGETSTTSSVLAVLPQLGATPATTSLTELAIAAKAAAIALQAIGGSSGGGSSGGGFFETLVGAVVNYYTGSSLTVDPNGAGIVSGDSSLSATSDLIRMRRASGGPVLADTPVLVGEMGPELYVPPTWGHILNADDTEAALAVAQWDKATRYHTGGVVGDEPDAIGVRMGVARLPSDPRSAPAEARAFELVANLREAILPNLAPDERATVLRVGEEVITANDPRHRTNGGRELLAGIGRGGPLAFGGLAGRDLVEASLPALQGLASLAADESPVVLQLGEEVLTTDDPRHRANGGLELLEDWPRYHTGGIVGDEPDDGPLARLTDGALKHAEPRPAENEPGTRGRSMALTVNVQAMPGMSRATVTQQGEVIGRQVALAVRRNG